MIVNGFLREDKFTSLYASLCQSAERHDIKLELKTNIELMYDIASGSAVNYNEPRSFAIFWDKDVRLVSALEGFRGEIEQTAPMYSAVSIDGKRLYQLAREGAQLVEIKRKAYVAELELLHKTKPNSFLLRMVCSRGTYVRTICSDIGKAMGVPAYMSFLLRTRSGEFTIENAYSIAELKKLKEEGRLEESVISMEQALNPIMEKIRLETSAKSRQS
mgnify:CR=1 FL=1